MAMRSLIIGEANEEAQKIFFDAYRQWLKDNRIVSFYFEAFDEKWKGGVTINPTL